MGNTFSTWIFWLLYGTSYVLSTPDYLDGGQVETVLEHSFDEGHSWSVRGLLTLSGLDSASGGMQRATLEARNDLTDQELEAFNKLIDNDGLYRIRIPHKIAANLGAAPDAVVKHVSSFNEACLLAQSSLSDVIHLSIDSSRQAILTVGIFPAMLSLPACADARKSRDAFPPLPSTFNTTIRITDIIEGPAPDTQSYLARIERDRREKETGQTQDNRSFIAKYWMYIVPVLIFLMFSNIVNPDNQAAAAR